MPIACAKKLEHGREHCFTNCPVDDDTFRLRRIERPEDVPDPDPRAVDVVILDMNHGWPNLGHDSLVHAVLDATCDLRGSLEGTGLHVRALSYDVRRSGMVPAGPDRFSLYVGTGGPGHIDPRRNDGVSPGTQGIDEDPSWEAPLFRLFDDIVAHDEAALLAVCHTYGILCRWSGAATPVLRRAEKGGKSSGVLENVLTPEAVDHPWFGRLADALPSEHRLRIVDNRLYDLVPSAGAFPSGVLPIGFETRGVGGPRGDAVTMLEFARDAGGVMPRVFAVNHHPEIVDRGRQMLILRQKQERGEVSEAWVQERMQILTETYPDENSDQRLHLTSDYTLLGPLRFHLQRLLRRQADALGVSLDLEGARLLSA